MFAKKHVLIIKVSFPCKKSPCLYSQFIAKNKPLMEWLKFIGTRVSGREGGDVGKKSAERLINNKNYKNIFGHKV
jgi:hypothetical protein